MDQALKREIEGGVKLAKPSDAETKAREEAKKKRLEELEKLKKSLESKS